MPNWAEGTLKIRGTKENILNFLGNELLGSTYPVFLNDEVGYKHRTVEHEINNYGEYVFRCEGGFYINNTRRAFIYNTELIFDLYEDDDEIPQIEIEGFKQAWGVVSDNYVYHSKKYDLDMKIFAFERGMEFTQEIELCKGKIVKDVAEEHKDYFWTVPFAELGG
ncbi:Uncharacterised protein [Listeria ivanovii subsp. londoniensis]|uniref:Uncharacterized protein n=1 Tax=Listeria ivanovii TaxID=1638 RepID=A0AAX2DT88_LISIV|nr:hypothetical protein [Listeria ivanovii]EFR97186.1 conserved hypothetical protein [Listeria ivanovii FSL F6-596]SDX37274.1 hypothetical protein SAMN05421782_1198 [Listeria ivanovii]VEH45969.1 Uncharacterised protein [Listeria ivanovii subsp. londoniensis]